MRTATLRAAVVAAVLGVWGWASAAPGPAARAASGGDLRAASGGDPQAPRVWSEGYTLVVLEKGADLHAARRLVQDEGGTVALLLPPRILMGWIPPGIDAALLGRAGILSIHREPVEGRAVRPIRHGPSLPDPTFSCFTDSTRRRPSAGPPP